MVTDETHYWEKFGFFGGHVFLDFINTFDDLGKTRQLDAFNNWAELLRWSEKAGLLNEVETRSLGKQASTKITDLELDRLRNFRESAWQVLSQTADNQSTKANDYAALSDILKWGYGRARLKHDGQKFQWLAPIDSEDITVIRARLALSGAELLTSDAITRIAECGSCTGLFLNTGRGVGRKWCRMKTCGNRAKIHRFRATK